MDTESQFFRQLAIRFDELKTCLNAARQPSKRDKNAFRSIRQLPERQHLVGKFTKLPSGTVLQTGEFFEIPETDQVQQNHPPAFIHSRSG
jgi:hypothetical protein